MSDEAKQHLFEPFFTTKENGQGLGMSIVYGIVSRHRGEIEVLSTPNKGTTVRMSFPRLRVEPPQPLPVRDEKLGCFRAARILLVEDDDLVRGTFEEILASRGHKVAAVPTGAKGLSIFGEGGFDLVITDLGVPDMSGFDVAKGVKRLDPATPVVLVSGWAVQQESGEVREAGIEYVLPKPCPLEDLLETIQKALRGAVASRP
jgi:CheY-like chemotaxis protein